MHDVTQMPPILGRHRRAFTLIELLVVIAIVAVVSVLSVVAVGRLSKDARISGAVNQVLAALDEARATAIRTNRSTAVLFVPTWDPSRPEDRQVTECVPVRWSGDQIFANGVLVDVFEAVPDVQRRALPTGIKVAGPFYAIGADDIWLTQSELRLTDPDRPPNQVEYSGQIFGVLFAPDGSLITSNVSSFASEAFFDIDRDGVQDLGDPPVIFSGAPRYFNNEVGDESLISFVTVLSVYDDDVARELKPESASGQNPWRFLEGYQEGLVGEGGFISQFGQKLSFNRYTGIPFR